MGTKKHRCRIGCGKPLAKCWHLLCPECWAEVPKDLQDAVYHEYKAGKGSSAHLSAILDIYKFFHGRETQQ